MPLHMTRPIHHGDTGTHVQKAWSVRRFTGCVNLVGPWGAHIFGQTLFWMFLCEWFG